MKKYLFLLCLVFTFVSSTPAEANVLGWLSHSKTPQAIKKERPSGIRPNATIYSISDYILLKNGKIFSVGKSGKKTIKRWKAGDPLSLQSEGRSVFTAINLRTYDKIYLLKRGYTR